MRTSSLTAGITGVMAVASGAATWWLARRFSNSLPPTDVAWLLIPYALLLVLAVLTWRSTLAAAVTLLGGLAISGFGLVTLHGIFTAPPDGQGVYGVVAVVLIQTIACVAILPALLACRFGQWLVAPERKKPATVQA